jgi:hypothetical protein
MASDEVEVVISDFGHTSVEVDLDRDIAKVLERSGNPFECEVEIMGVRHPADSHYPTKFNSRTIQRRDDLCRLKEESRWLATCDVGILLAERHRRQRHPILGELRVHQEI